MITKTDCMLLLTNLSKSGVDTKDALKKVVLEDSVSLEVLKFINSKRPLDLASFYEMLRKNYNSKKSKVYINIMKEFDEEDIDSVTVTLNSYAQQVLLFGKSVEHREIFYRFARLAEVYQCLYAYSTKFNLTPCIQLLRLIKTDIKALETIYREDKKLH